MKLILHAVLWLILWGSVAAADSLRIATYNAGLSREGPGLLLRDIKRGKSPDINAAVARIIAANPDILALQGFDWDHDNAALQAFNALLTEDGKGYRYLLSLRPNTGMATGLDMDGNGRLGQARDAQGFGSFSGQNGIAVLSRFPILFDDVRDFSELLWADLPGAVLPKHADGRPFPSTQAQSMQRLSSTGHWVVPIQPPDAPLVTVLTYQAGPPVFDGPEDRNGLRNRDENRFWSLYLDGNFGPPPRQRFILAGGANLDPHLGEGLRDAIADLLSDPRLNDPFDNWAPTVTWNNVGAMRVDYVLPSADLEVLAKGQAESQSGQEHGNHSLVWVDIQNNR